MAENYENEFQTIGNDKLPVKATVEAILCDQLFAVNLATGNKSDVACFVFKPVHASQPVTDRDLTTNFLPMSMNQSVVNWTSPDDTGLPPEVPIAADTTNYRVTMVTSQGNASIIAKIQFSIKNSVIALVVHLRQAVPPPRVKRTHSLRVRSKHIHPSRRGGSSVISNPDKHPIKSTMSSGRSMPITRALLSVPRRALTHQISRGTRTFA